MPNGDGPYPAIPLDQQVRAVMKKVEDQRMQIVELQGQIKTLTEERDSLLLALQYIRKGEQK